MIARDPLPLLINVKKPKLLNKKISIFNYTDKITNSQGKIVIGDLHHIQSQKKSTNIVKDYETMRILKQRKSGLQRKTQFYSDRSHYNDGFQNLLEELGIRKIEMELSQEIQQRKKSRQQSLVRKRQQSHQLEEQYFEKDRAYFKQEHHIDSLKKKMSVYQKEYFFKRRESINSNYQEDLTLKKCMNINLDYYQAMKEQKSQDPLKSPSNQNSPFRMKRVSIINNHSQNKQNEIKNRQSVLKDYIYSQRNSISKTKPNPQLNTDILQLYFFQWIKSDQQEKVQNTLLKYPKFINVQDYQGFTPIFWAIKKENEKMFYLLLDFSPDLTIIDKVYLFNRNQTLFLILQKNLLIKSLLKFIQQKDFKKD